MAAKRRASTESDEADQLENSQVSKRARTEDDSDVEVEVEGVVADGIKRENNRIGKGQSKGRGKGKAKHEDEGDEESDEEQPAADDEDEKKFEETHEERIRASLEKKRQVYGVSLVITYYI